MKRRAFVAGIVGGMTTLAGCTSQSSPDGGSSDQSSLSLRSTEVIEYKPKDYEDRPDIAGAIKVTVENSGSNPLTLTNFRVSGDVPRPHDETQPGRFTVPSQDLIDQVEVSPGEKQQLRMRHEPLYYVDLDSEGERSQEDLDTSTCTGETRTATLHFETEERGTIDKEIKLEFAGQSVEFDELAPDYGCTNVTVSQADSA